MMDIPRLSDILAQFSYSKEEQDLTWGYFANLKFSVLSVKLGQIFGSSASLCLVVFRSV